MNIPINVKDTIFKSSSEVFEAIVNRDKIIGYFVSSASDSISEGKDIKWEFKEYNVSLQVKVKKVIINEFISFEWSATGEIALVEIRLSSDTANVTTIDITEKPYQTKEEEIKKALQQTQGWTDFICSLKAYLYTGINLRNGQMNTKIN
ncbi:SRPBCC domain-containing protein [Ulvibacter antarcticus]|uniref:Uncharacterized protein YndB with AHSA1/START domain n=1 Tax=Ulvibacter antarcticus TaxID=442714 RepID=A0A3L9YD08_9FLAO|nr:SRPBCC domain-containing protein [Ulvibacter antarcticus]RMA58531.1 uncharacterized protein YndB with AHSA1/START domain [Ulvibacter antarcticus]